MDAAFVASCSTSDQLPVSELLEVAIVGRSNCGKSSLINVLTQRPKLAKTSSTPGRTQQIVFFRVTDSELGTFHLVDLPGYGYAKVSKQQQAQFGLLVTDYVDTRQQLRAILLLVDIRREVTDDELRLVEWARRRNLELLVVLTKADKLPKSQRFSALEAAKKSFGLPRRPIAVSTLEPALFRPLRDELTALMTRLGTRAPSTPSSSELG